MLVISLAKTMKPGDKQQVTINGKKRQLELGDLKVILDGTDTRKVLAVQDSGELMTLICSDANGTQEDITIIRPSVLAVKHVERRSKQVSGDEMRDMLREAGMDIVELDHPLTSAEIAEIARNHPGAMIYGPKEVRAEEATCSP